MTYISAALRREVIERAGNRCEYCLLPAEVAFYPHEVDHVIAEKHGGATDIDNLAFACWRCNRHKGGAEKCFLGIDFERLQLERIEPAATERPAEAKSE